MQLNLYIQLKSWIVALLLLVALSACAEDEESVKYMAGFTAEKDADNPNLVHFTNTSSGNYIYVQWDYGKGNGYGAKEVDKTSVRSINFPYKGTYEVTLRVWGNLNSTDDTETVTKTITIESDDPDYSGGNLLWSDEFEGTSVNTANWTFETGSGGWGNQELQNYTSGNNAHIEDGILVITAKKENDAQTAGSYTSTRMISWGKQEFTYGRIEVRAKLPSGRGIWPAIWMLGANLGTAGWPACGEIDIMEYVGFEPEIVHGTVHTTSGSGANGNGGSKDLVTAEEEFHIYGIIWTQDSITFYVDTPDNIVHTYAPASKNADNWPFNKPHFFILNVAVGGTWGGAQGIDNSIFPQTMKVDYVRVYELDS